MTYVQLAQTQWSELGSSLWRPLCVLGPGSCSPCPSHSEPCAGFPSTQGQEKAQQQHPQEGQEPQRMCQTPVAAGHHLHPPRPISKIQPIVRQHQSCHIPNTCGVMSTTTGQPSECPPSCARLSFPLCPPRAPVRVSGHAAVPPASARGAAPPAATAGPGAGSSSS